MEKDLAFFDRAKAGGFSVKKLLEKMMEKVMFEKDPGVEGLRSDATTLGALTCRRMNG